MKKSFKLVDLDCANCARKMEDAIKKLDGVNDATVSFLTQNGHDRGRAPAQQLRPCPAHPHRQAGQHSRQDQGQRTGPEPEGPVLLGVFILLVHFVPP